MTALLVPASALSWERKRPESCFWVAPRCIPPSLPSQDCAELARGGDRGDQQQEHVFVSLRWPSPGPSIRLCAESYKKKSCCHGESSTWTRFLSRMCCSSRARPRQQHSFLLAGGCTQGLCEAGSKPGKSPAPVSPCQLLLGSGSGAKRGGGRGCFCSLGYHICSPSAGCVVRGSSWGAGAVVASCLPSSVT